MRARVLVVDHVPHLRQQRSVEAIRPKDASGYKAVKVDERPGRYLPGQLGRFPTVGLDEGALRHSRPDTSPINNR